MKATTVFVVWTLAMAAGCKGADPPEKADPAPAQARADTSVTATPGPPEAPPTTTAPAAAPVNLDEAAESMRALSGKLDAIRSHFKPASQPADTPAESPANAETPAGQDSVSSTDGVPNDVLWVTAMPVSGGAAGNDGPQPPVVVLGLGGDAGGELGARSRDGRATMSPIELAVAPVAGRGARIHEWRPSTGVRGFSNIYDGLSDASAPEQFSRQPALARRTSLSATDQVLVQVPPAQALWPRGTTPRYTVPVIQPASPRPVRRVYLKQKHFVSTSAGVIQLKDDDEGDGIEIAWEGRRLKLDLFERVELVGDSGGAFVTCVAKDLPGNCVVLVIEE